MPPPLAYFLTWTTKGTWLHGDPRGSADRTQNRVGTPRLLADPTRASRDRMSLRSEAFVMDERARLVVDGTIRGHCERRGWEIRAINVRSNHVHLVVACRSDVTPEDAMSQCKAWSTRRLREAGILDADAKAWTRHGSTKWIDSEATLAAAVDYVSRHQ
jgi:REP element-mobilizing transposase RayT